MLPVRTANFRYAISGKVIAITSLKLGQGSFSEEIEKFLRKMEYYHARPITDYRILYYDADGFGGEVKWDGEHAEIIAPP